MIICHRTSMPQLIVTWVLLLYLSAASGSVCSICRFPVIDSEFSHGSIFLLRLRGGGRGSSDMKADGDDGHSEEGWERGDGDRRYQPSSRPPSVQAHERTALGYANSQERFRSNDNSQSATQKWDHERYNPQQRGSETGGRMSDDSRMSSSRRDSVHDKPAYDRQGTDRQGYHRQENERSGCDRTEYDRPRYGRPDRATSGYDGPGHDRPVRQGRWVDQLSVRREEEGGGGRKMDRNPWSDGRRDTREVRRFHERDVGEWSKKGHERTAKNLEEVVREELQPDSKADAGLTMAEKIQRERATERKKKPFRRMTREEEMEEYTAYERWERRQKKYRDDDNDDGDDDDQEQSEKDESSLSDSRQEKSGEIRAQKVVGTDENLEGKYNAWDKIKTLEDLGDTEDERREGELDKLDNMFDTAYRDKAGKRSDTSGPVVGPEVAASLLPPTMWDQEKYDDLCEHVFDLVGKGDVDAAEDLLMKELDADPNSAPALLAYAWVRNDVSAAEELYSSALETYPRCIPILSGYAGFLLETKHDRTGAKAVYQRAIELDPMDIALKYNLAVVHHLGSSVGDEGSSETAEQLYRTALEADPTHLESLSNLAVLLHESARNLTEAEILYVRVLRKSPNETTALFGYARLLMERAEYDKADLLFVRLVQIHQDSFENAAHFLRVYGRMLSISNQTELAETVFDELLDHGHRTEEVLADYADMLLKLGRQEDATSLTRPFNVTRPIDLPLMNESQRLQVSDEAAVYAEVLRRVGDEKGAIVWYTTALERNPAQMRALKGYTAMLNPEDPEDVETVNKVFSEALTLVHDVTLKRVEVLLAYAHAVKNQAGSRKGKALTLALEALELCPNHVDSLLLCANLLLQQSSVPADKAGEHLQQCLEANPRHTLARLHMGRVQLEDEQYLPAERSFGYVLMEEPTNFEALKNLGRLLVSRAKKPRDYERGVVFLKAALQMHPNDDEVWDALNKYIRRPNIPQVDTPVSDSRVKSAIKDTIDPVPSSQSEAE